MEKSARLYHCARCHKQVVICSRCDRGNIYCGPICSQQARVLNHRIANQKYQKSLKGKQKNAERQRRCRERKEKKVTDQSSKEISPNDSLPQKPKKDNLNCAQNVYCHFCRQAVSGFLRNGYLNQHKKDKSDYFSSWPLGP